MKQTTERPEMKSAKLDAQAALARAEAALASHLQKRDAARVRWAEADAKALASESAKDFRAAREAAEDLADLERVTSKREADVEDAKKALAAAEQADAVQAFLLLDTARQLLVQDYLKVHVPELLVQEVERLQALLNMDIATREALDHARSLGAPEPFNPAWPQLSPSFLITRWDDAKRAMVPDVPASLAKALQDLIDAPRRELEQKLNDERVEAMRANEARQRRLMGNDGPEAREAELAEMRRGYGVAYGSGNPDVEA
ncbi:MAG TPA: hypothetical protein VFG53_19890 [Anaeromyxobacter sp.]|nr:hypothetical protein [Anaeromyxobacter sp.]